MRGREFPIRCGSSVLQFLCCIAVLLGGCGSADRTNGVTVAVAANFLSTAEQIADEFTRRHGSTVTLVSGSTGKLYTQIVNGAPYDVFLAADSDRPKLLERSGVAVAGTGIAYAFGRLTLWSRDTEKIRGNGAAILERRDFRRLAIANPALAPYGAAARQLLERLDAWQGLADRLVMGENVAQAYALVATGNAELGLVALAQVLGERHTVRGSRWDVPAEMHDPIEQRAILLQRAAGNPVARQFLEFLLVAEVREIIEHAGYAVE